MMQKEIKVFIISPSDVNIEREAAQKVCQELNEATGEGINIKAILWEYHPMSYSQNAQENIDNVMDTCDIFIVILWNRLGSVVVGYEGGITKSKNVTGTQYEIEKVLATKKESVFFYFKRAEKHFSSNELEEASRQKYLLDTFLKNIHLSQGSTKHGYHEFKHADEFKKKLKEHLIIEVEKRVGIEITVALHTFKKYSVLWTSILFVSVFVLLAQMTYNEGFFSMSQNNRTSTFVYSLKIDSNIDIHNSQLLFDIKSHFLRVLNDSKLHITQYTKHVDVLMINLKYDIQKTDSSVSGHTIIKRKCSLRYTIFDPVEKKILKSGFVNDELTSFNDGKDLDCFQKLYIPLKKQLVQDVKEIENKY